LATEQRFAYRAYGLTIHSWLPLPELFPAPADSTPDLVFSRVEPAAIPSAWRTFGAHFDDPLHEVALSYGDGGSFVVRAGREIAVVVEPGRDEAAIRLNLLGVALAVAQHQRGRLVLHGSAILVNGKVLVFLGGGGGGKSTLAASLHAAGFPLIADDLAALEFVAGVALVQPAFPQQKLWPDTISALGADPLALPPVTASATKRNRRLDGPFATRALPLDRLYVLADGAKPALAPLSGSDALAECVRHSFCAGLLARSGDVTHFRHCADAIRQAPVARLERPQDFAALPLVRQLILDDLAVPHGR
jgi:hypothetical protein